MQAGMQLLREENRKLKQLIGELVDTVT